MAGYCIDPINKFKYTKDSDGEYHSYNDGPAIEYFDGTKIWMTHGILDRDEKCGPALALVKGKFRSEYYKMGLKHCILRSDSNNEYYDNGKLLNLLYYCKEDSLYDTSQITYVHNGELKKYPEFSKLLTADADDNTKNLYVVNTTCKTYLKLPLDTNTYIVKRMHTEKYYHSDNYHSNDENENTDKYIEKYKTDIKLECGYTLKDIKEYYRRHHNLTYSCIYVYNDTHVFCPISKKCVPLPPKIIESDTIKL